MTEKSTPAGRPYNSSFGSKGNLTVWLVSVCVMVITSMPYLYGEFLRGSRPEFGYYSWFNYTISDPCVYLSWMQQAADGHFFHRNLFTNEFQLNYQFNLFFLSLGSMARITGLSTIVVYLVARFLLGVCFLRAIWWLVGLFLEGRQSKINAFLVVCFSAGFGWIPAFWQLDRLGPVDIWQPEAISFLSIYLYPLFTVSLLLMVGIVGWLITAERTGDPRYALLAGMCGLLLGNIHTYDVIPIMAAWNCYLIIQFVVDRRIGTGSLKRWGIVSGLTAVSTGYMVWLLKTEHVFAKRVAIETLSPPLLMYLLGFGPVFILGVVGALNRRRMPVFRTERVAANSLAFNPRCFLVVWFIVNVAVSYLPVAFQRKMIMGAHLPLAILAGAALTMMLTPIGPNWRRIVLSCIIIFLSLSNLRFVTNSIVLLSKNKGSERGGRVRPFLLVGEVSSLDWVRSKTPPQSVIQPLPWIALDPSTGKYEIFDYTLACFTPGLTGHPVHAGHWAETPDFMKKMALWSRFLQPDTSEEWRRDFLRSTGVKYVLFSQKSIESRDQDTYKAILAPFLSGQHPSLRIIPEASNPDVNVYEVSSGRISL
ncbi:hypothetical protein [Geomonas azotofigens]|uniref:hypothetical protein n=1 Tax=Geomonas azotofigens TaxID=2843196 RepID=UPI001C0F4CED|nr:hypothetical protein [Geomonas azotofigens]MBU5612483.1 hypothetical protein [Geomonas azotofigens]